MTRQRLIDVGIPLVIAVVSTIEAATSTDIDASWPVCALFVLGTSVPLCGGGACRPSSS